MNGNGFGSRDYDVMANSCNSFTAALARRLLDGHLPERYPSGVLHQSRLADILSPVARALDLVPAGDEQRVSSSFSSGSGSASSRKRRGVVRVSGSLKIAGSSRGSAAAAAGGPVAEDGGGDKEDEERKKATLGKRRSL